MEQIISAVTAVSNWLWGYPMLVLIVGGGIFLTVRLGFFQFVYFPYIMRQTFGSMLKKIDGEGSVSPFSAATTALASTIGASNIIGVPVAIAFGGPGAVLWMWATALIGSATKFTEVVLGLYYREKNSEGYYVGGPMYYLSKGLKNKRLGSSMAFTYAFGTMVVIFFSVAAQSVSATQTVEVLGVAPWLAGVSLMLLVGVVVFGGITRIASVTEKLVPFMAVLYILGSLGVIAANAAQIPAVFVLIFKSAFSGSAAAGGFAGAGIAAAMRWGIARGTYSSEAGMGSAPIAHSAATTDHAVRQGFWGIFEVTVSAIIICTMTALVVLTSGVWTKVGTANAAAMPSIAFQSVLGERFGGGVVSVCMLLFVLSTVIVIIYYGEKQAEYLFGTFFSKLVKFGYIAAIFLGAVGGLEFIFQFLDFVLGITVIPNIVGLLMMSGKAVELKKEFFSDPRYYLKDTAKCQHEEAKILIGNEE